MGVNHCEQALFLIVVVPDGAAEEAGLMVGDNLLAVNGTDVSSVPHSEAAELARQGVLLLTVWTKQVSRISHCSTVCEWNAMSELNIKCIMTNSYVPCD